MIWMAVLYLSLGAHLKFLKCECARRNSIWKTDHLQLAKVVERLFVFFDFVRWLVLKRKYTEAQREVEKIARVRVIRIQINHWHA